MSTDSDPAIKAIDMIDGLAALMTWPIGQTIKRTSELMGIDIKIILKAAAYGITGAIIVMAAQIDSSTGQMTINVLWLTALYTGIAGAAIIAALSFGLAERYTRDDLEPSEPLPPDSQLERWMAWGWSMAATFCLLAILSGETWGRMIAVLSIAGYTQACRAYILYLLLPERTKDAAPNQRVGNTALHKLFNTIWE